MSKHITPRKKRNRQGVKTVQDMPLCQALEERAALRDRLLAGAPNRARRRKIKATFDAGDTRLIAAYQTREKAPGLIRARVSFQ